MKTKLLTIVLGLILITKPFASLAQKASPDVLENVLSAVVTVGVFETGAAKKSLGFRGNASEMAYAKMLDLSGASGSGSGFIITYNGKPYVVTNAHVIEQAADTDGSIYVYSINRSKYKAKVMGGDSFYDIAVLEFIDKPSEEINTIEFRAEPARVGEPVYAVGNPLGEYPYSVSDGIISAKNRVRGGLTGKFGFLQSTATVIWGNSGGPLVDVNGKVVGINSQIAFANQGNSSIWQPQINFALEAQLSSRLVNDILTNDGLISRSYFGIELVQKKLPYPPGTQQYAYYSRMYETDDLPLLKSVDAAGPAATLKAFEGAQLKAINGEPVRSLEEALGEFERIAPGKETEFTLIKSGQVSKVKVKGGVLNEDNSARIGKAFLDQGGFTYKNAPNQFLVSTTAQQNGSQFSTVSNSGAQVIPAGNFQVVGIGLLDEGYESVWRVANLADVGTAARLTGMTGVVDMVLLRAGADPQKEQNYFKKRIGLSTNDKLVQQTLWY
ncbi:trypsin-like serine protease [Mucilaginibacter limnophilus]|uniref:Trypsin-like serine protease n=1 Tax=Mucilaginibacter limnophilus TaxID=1932778 RepID=A0A3S2UKT2_9SPHI|nr:trypsin-like peptidase domain-containing protein [Mucilaginibacter limnophilus]RVU00129.1 trypsin-like serine protease [Mucilaginibacter limnophilus]